jgi:hypothetical protein
LGRFINEDTYEGDITNPLSLNLYTYVKNNPLRYVDPTGHQDMVADGGGFWYPEAEPMDYSEPLHIKEYIDLMIIDPLKTLFSSKSSNPEKLWAASSFIPIGKVVSTGERVFVKLMVNSKEELSEVSSSVKWLFYKNIYLKQIWIGRI